MTTETTNKPLSAREAAMQVVREADGPVSASAIADTVLERGLAGKLKGKTPKATIAAQVYTAAKRGELKKVDGGFVLPDAA
jgi:hypothetical protein